ncbi:MAG: hypothetical protein Q9182_001580 [Xanthomendoza sp. 2 TL-2023]
MNATNLIRYIIIPLLLGSFGAYIFSPSFSTFVDVIACRGVVACGYVFVVLVWAHLVWTWILGPAMKLIDSGFALCRSIYGALLRVTGLASRIRSWRVGKEVTAEVAMDIPASRQMMMLSSRARSSRDERGQQYHARTEGIERREINSHPWNDSELWSYIESDVDEDEAAKDECVDKSLASTGNGAPAVEIYQDSDRGQTLAAKTFLPRSLEAEYHNVAREMCQVSSLHNSHTATHYPSASQEDSLRTMTAKPRDILTLRQQDSPSDQARNSSTRPWPPVFHPTTHEIIAKIKIIKAESVKDRYPAKPTLDLATFSATQSQETSYDERDSSPLTTPYLGSPDFWQSSSSESSEPRDREELVSVALPRIKKPFQDRWSSVFTDMADASEREVLDRFEAALSRLAGAEAYG